ncbi:MAG: energy-coupling factor transporter ATPase [Acholeplasmatales bacterium]|nr:energy-coupling factor transporter ATPase [Acholeplasmatales bacterium]
MIEFKNIHFAYNKEDIALRGVSFDVKEGEWLSIIGHNGSGKSTIAKLLIGLIKPNKGDILYDGKSLLNDNETLKYVRDHVGIVFQNPDNQFVGFNVKYDIAFGLENHKVPREEMEKLIDDWTKKVDMNEYLSREPETLSGGQKQRVAIAGIMALDCDIIILDEATSMLDPKGQEEIVELIKNIKKNYNKTLITITHDLDFAMNSDRIIVLKEGKIISEGKPSDIFKERDILLSSNLDMPFSQKAYYLASLSDKLKDNKELMDSLWEYYSTV